MSEAEIVVNTFILLCIGVAAALVLAGLVMQFFSDD